MASSNLIELIKKLRELTGAGMMDCKNALEANDLDLDKAGDYLREKGIAKAAKKAERIAAEGLSDVTTCPKCGKCVVLEVNCETDFVARGDDFKKLVSDTADVILKNEPANLEQAKDLCKELYTEATVRIGEKLDLRRFDLLKPTDTKVLGTYIHMGGKIAVAVVLSGGDKEFAEQLAMHIAANSPKYVNPSDIPSEVIEKETAIQIEASKTDPKLANKPENILRNIIKGKVDKILFESVLSEQPYLLDDSKKVGQVLSENKVEVVKFVRYQVGEGIEKRQDDFAKEVMEQAK